MGQQLPMVGGAAAASAADEGRAWKGKALRIPEWVWPVEGRVAKPPTMPCLAERRGGVG